jgi:phage baseplate assembly protein W|tara:strand:- start:1097 stop:1507 length:411 start_codon:yes stop_codon:yes gene_type:complete
MAFEVKKIDPIDLEPRKAVGVSLPFSGKAVFNSTFETKEAIKTNLINYFLTGRGERFLNPTFGNKLQPLLFEQLTQEKVKEINATVTEDIENLFPRVQPMQINTIGDPDTNTVQFSMSYKLRDSNIQDEVVINFYN